MNVDGWVELCTRLHLSLEYEPCSIDECAGVGIVVIAEPMIGEPDRVCTAHADELARRGVIDNRREL